MQTIRIRQAVEEDYNAVMGLMRQLNPDDPELADFVGHPLYLQILNSTEFSIVVAEDGASIVGACYLNVIPNLTRCASPYAVIENVVTHPDFRRRGVGRTLLSSAVDLAKHRGCYKVMLLSGGDHSVHEFYESCGFTSGVKKAFVKRFDNSTAVR